jgi:uncharacterized protein YxjI
MLNLKTYLIREQVGMFKLTDTYDIYDAVSNQQVATAKEEPPGVVKFLRLLVNKTLMPTQVNVYETSSGQVAFSIKRGFTFLRARVEVLDSRGTLLGYFKSKLFSLGGGFYVFNPQDQQVAEVKGDWKGWNFKLIGSAGQELGTVAKQWAGLAKEMFSSADNYVIALADDQASTPAGNMLLLAAGLAIDIIFKEARG